MGLAASVAIVFTLVFASCSKDGVFDSDTQLTITAQQGTDETISYYAITDTEGIGFCSEGIEYLYLKDGSRKWLLSYEEIAKQLDLEIDNFEQIRITRDKVLKNGLWRFAVSFDTQDKDESYAIDVDPETGKIIWIISTGRMPGGEFTLKISV